MIDKKCYKVVAAGVDPLRGLVDGCRQSILEEVHGLFVDAAEKRRNERGLAQAGP